MTRISKCVAQARDDQPTRQARITKAHLRFGGMHVDVHKLWITVDKKRRRWVTVTAQEIEISGAQGPGQQLVFDRAAIDEQKLRPAAPREYVGKAA